MNALRVLLTSFVVYVGIVLAFESLLGYFQPQAGGTLVITTTDDQGRQHDRVVSKLETAGQLYVAANHWPRAWYEQALAHPDVQVTIDGKRGDYRAVPVSGAEHDRVLAEHPHSLAFRIVTGFPPRYFLRLEPR